MLKTKVSYIPDKTEKMKMDMTETDDNNGDDMFSKFNLCDASDLTNDVQNGPRSEEDKAEVSDTSRILNVEDNQNQVKEDDRRCSVDITPTLRVTGTVSIKCLADHFHASTTSKIFARLFSCLHSLGWC